MASITIRIGFIGVDGSAVALSAEPSAKASAVIFSAIDQLRRYFELYPTRSSEPWVNLFHELAQANVKDAEEKQQQSKCDAPTPRTAATSSARTYAKRVIARKISFLSIDGDHFIPGHEAVKNDSCLVGNIFRDSFYWMDLTDPPCRVHVAAFGASSDAAAAAIPILHSEVLDQVALIATWTVENIFQRVAEKTNGAVHPHDLECYFVQQVPRFVGDDCSNLSPLARNTALIDLLRNSRTVELEVRTARAPSVTVRVVEVDVADVATKNSYQKMGFAGAPNDVQDDPSFYNNSHLNERRSRQQQHQQQQQQQHQQRHDEELLVPDPYNSASAGNDPYSFIEMHCRRTLSLVCSEYNSGRKFAWSTSLAELHRETSKLIAPLRGRGFLCLEPSLIRRSAEAAADGDFGNAVLRLASTGKPNGSQVPVFAPELTLRQVAIMTTRRQNNNNNNGSRNNNNNNSCGPSSTILEQQQRQIRLYVLVNSREKEKPKMVFARAAYSEEILHEADHVRFQLLDVLYPAAREARLFQYQQQQQNLSSLPSSTSFAASTRLKKQNVVPGSPDDTQLQVTNSYRYRNNNSNNNSNAFGNQILLPNQSSATDNSSRCVQFRVDDVEGTDELYFVGSSDQANAIVSTTSSDFVALQPPLQSPRFSPPRPRPRSHQPHQHLQVPIQQPFEQSAPTSPVHSEGVEAFISIPKKSSSSLSSSSSSRTKASEVMRLLLPDGYFPVRRLKRFLRMQQDNDGDDARTTMRTMTKADFQLQFGTKVLVDDDDDVKNYVNPDTNVVFLNAF